MRSVTICAFMAIGLTASATLPSDSHSDLAKREKDDSDPAFLRRLLTSTALFSGININIKNVIFQNNGDAKIDVNLGGKDDNKGDKPLGPVVPKPPPTDKCDPPIALGSSDRFASGNNLPKGLGTAAAEVKFDSSLTYEEISSGLQSLGKKYPEVKLEEAPYKTVNGRPLKYAVIGKPKVLVTTGLNGHDRGGPDAALYFLSDLLQANQANTGLTYNSKAYSNADVKKALSVGAVFSLLSNPDGIVVDQEQNSCWANNNNTANDSKGVNIVHDLFKRRDEKNLFNPEAIAAKEDAQRETRGLAWVLTTYKEISVLSTLLALDPNKLTSPPSDTSKPAVVLKQAKGSSDLSKRADNKEASSTTSKENEKLKQISQDAAAAMKKGNAETPPAFFNSKTVKPATSKSCGMPQISEHRLEFGKPSCNPCAFYPNATAYREVVENVSGVLMTTLLKAADDTSKNVVKCESPEDGTPGPQSTQPSGPKSSDRDHLPSDKSKPSKPKKSCRPRRRRSPGKDEVATSLTPTPATVATPSTAADTLKKSSGKRPEDPTPLPVEPPSRRPKRISTVESDNPQ